MAYMDNTVERRVDALDVCNKVHPHYIAGRSLENVNEWVS